MPRSYDNFDLELSREGDGYTAKARSPRGEARTSFRLPLSQQELRILALSIARGRRTSRAIKTREVDEVKAYGERLFDALFAGDILACYLDNLAQIRGSDAGGLRVRLHLSDVPELAQVPWEYLYDRRSGRFLALQDETPIVRYLNLPLHAEPLEITPPLHILVMISGPKDLPELDANEEWKRLKDALAGLEAAGIIRLDRLEKPTLEALRWQLKAEEYHVFHFIGHGGIDAITDRGVLILEDESGASDAVEAEVLAGILSAEKALRLAVLNACEGGRASKGDIFAGTAQTLVQQDLPAVIAMQFEISDEAAIALTQDFYKSLASGDPVDAALTEARRGLRVVRRNESEWGTPVLFMRASDSRLFDVKCAPVPAKDLAPPPAPPPVPPPSPTPAVAPQAQPAPLLAAGPGETTAERFEMAPVTFYGSPQDAGKGPPGSGKGWGLGRFLVIGAGLLFLGVVATQVFQSKDVGSEVPSPPTSIQRVYLEAEVDVAAKALTFPLPPYPEAARAAGITGYVDVSYVVDTLGRVEPASWKLIHTTNPMFTDAARAATLAGVYIPARKGGAAVRQLVQQRLTFHPGQ